MYKYLFFLCLPISIFAQTNATIFPNLEGTDLLDALVEAYKPNPTEVASYGEARDILFGIIDRQNDSVTCIYTAHQVYLPDGEDPTTYIFQNGSPNGINTEHTYPQSMGAKNGAAKSDMHHLFPARVAVNTARGSLPFAEIQDFETDWWYYKNMENSSIPSTNKDAYSEGTNQFFEPRESKKGDVARAMMYFYTMYRSQADNANPTYFENQRNRLCQWHFEDPADQAEITRSELIAVYQDDKANPFVLDCTVAARCYCEEHPTCPITATEDVMGQNHWSVFPNPTRDILHIASDDTFPKGLLVQLWSIDGLQRFQTIIHDSSATIALDSLTTGLYFYEIQDLSNTDRQRGKLMLIQ